MGRCVSGWLVSIAMATGAGLYAQEAAPTAPVVSAPPAVSAPAAVEGGKIHGTVAAAGGTGKNAAPGIALPGVAITATNTLTGRKYTTTTDVDGKFALAIPKNGRYVVRAELAAFGTGAQEIVLNATQHEGTAAFTLELASRVKPAAEDTTDATMANAEAAMESVQSTGRGVQSLGVRNGGDASTEDATAAGSNSNNGTSLPSLSGFDSSSDSVSISGQMGQTNGLANYSEDEVRSRINDAIREARENGGTAMDGMNNAVSVLGGMMGGSMGGPGGRGSRGGGGGSRGGRGGGMGAGGFSISRGNFKGFNPGQVHGALYYHLGTSALDATQFSVTGTPFKPAYNVNRFGASFSGSPYIPRLTQPNPAQFLFLNFTGSRDVTPVNLTGNVPTAAQRAGDLRGLRAVYDPNTNQQFCNGAAGCSAGDPNLNIIPANRLDPTAQQLLAFIPLPNVNVNGYNYQRIANQGSNVTQFAGRFVRNFGQNASTPGGGFFGTRTVNGKRVQRNVLRQNMNIGFNYQHTGTDSRRIFSISDSKTAIDQYSFTGGYVIGYGRFNHSSSFSWSRSHSYVAGNYTNNPQPGVINALNVPRSLALGAFVNGFPTVSITNFNGITGVSPSDRHYQVFSYNDYIGWNHHKHNMRGGFNIRRQFSDFLGGNNTEGTLQFTGYNTQQYKVDPSFDIDPITGLRTIDPATGQRVPLANTGTGIADLVLGGPQQGKVQGAGYTSKLRAWIWSAYAQDDWRIRNNLTLNFGLRYEYFGPFIELGNRLVNLDPVADFSSANPVLATNLTNGFPRSLIMPDRALFSPRLGIAWTPIKFPIKQLVIRGGYGINYNTGQYTTFANSLSYQPQFADVVDGAGHTTVQTNTAEQFGCGRINSPSAPYTINTAFNCTSTNTVQNTFAIDKNYRLGRVQVVNVDLQKTFKLGIVANVGYNGSFGANLDMRRAPNRVAANTAPIGGQAYIYEDSIGDSRFHALSVSARKRMSRGIALGGTYIYGHSIDNASAINGQGNNTIPQNDKRLDLEYGNSTFDVRHQVSGDWVTELPFGPNRLWLTKGGLWSNVLDGFSLSGSYKFATGTYYTPQFAGTSAQVASGGNYTQRPDRIVGQPINSGSDTGTIGKWFNTAAFNTDPLKIASPQGYGTAQRNAIRGPGTVSVNMALARSQRIGTGTKSVEFRATATNVFNTVQYAGINVVVNSPYYGRVTSAAAPRKIQLLFRYRF